MNQRAFTLIELLVSVAIIGILASVVLITLRPDRLRKRAQDSNKKEDIGVIQGALESYYSDNNSYPPTTDWEDAIKNTNNVNYLNDVPVDPVSGDSYEYRQLNSGQSYCLCASLELDENTKIDECTISGVTHPYCVENPF